LWYITSVEWWQDLDADDRIASLALVVSMLALIVSLSFSWAKFRYTRRTYLRSFRPDVKVSMGSETRFDVRYGIRTRLTFDLIASGDAVIRFSLQVDVRDPKRGLRLWHPEYERYGTWSTTELATRDLITIEPPQGSLERFLVAEIPGAIQRAPNAPHDPLPEHDRYRAKLEKLGFRITARYQQAGESRAMAYRFTLKPLPDEYGFLREWAPA
jgi:hypothetical protein